MGCIGMGQAPASGQISLRTMPRNFPGRSGTKDDLVYLCSPETAAASALTGEITDPRSLGMSYPRFATPKEQAINTEMLVPPARESQKVELIKGPNISSLPDFEPLPDELRLEVLLKVEDDVSTDEIMPAGQRVLPFRSNIEKISQFVYWQVDDTYHERALKAKKGDGHAIVAGHNYGQGSSREHAAIAPRYLGLRVVVAKSFARIHWQNLPNFGILPLEFEQESDFDAVEQGDVLFLAALGEALKGPKRRVTAANETKDAEVTLSHRLSERQVSMVLKGGLIPMFKDRLTEEAGHTR